MKKKELLNEVSRVLKEKPEANSEIDILGKELLFTTFKLNFTHVLIYIIFLLLSALLFHKIDYLSFISEDFYIKLLGLFVLISTLIAIVCFTLYIYNRNKNKQFGFKELAKINKFYQIYDIFSFVALFITIFFWLVIFVITPVEVSGESMEKTFYDGDKILVWHIGYEPQNDDVVIIKATKYLNTDFIIKRVVATSGDTILYSEIDKTLTVNEVVVATNISKSQFQKMMTDVNNGKSYYEDEIVPEGFSIVLGDNQGNSTDSKELGLIANEDILGKFIFRIYPISKMGIPSKSN